MPARRALVGALLLFAAVPAQALPEVSVPPEDYPAGVTPGRREIRVTAAYALAADGSLHCRLVGRSRVRPIDEATCTILTTRALLRPVGEERILFHWSPAAPRAYPSRSKRGDPLAVIPLAEISPDYPAAALIEGEQGAVAFDIDVAPDGAPLACRIVSPAASAALNRATCDHFMRRAVFIPSVDAAGRPVQGTYRGWLDWHIAR